MNAWNHTCHANRWLLCSFCHILLSQPTPVVRELSFLASVVSEETKKGKYRFSSEIFTALCCLLESRNLLAATKITSIVERFPRLKEPQSSIAEVDVDQTRRSKI